MTDEELIQLLMNLKKQKEAELEIIVKELRKLIQK
jgi:hypothetical protein